LRFLQSEDRGEIKKLLINFFYSFLWLILIISILFLFLYYSYFYNPKIFGLTGSILLMLGVIYDGRFNIKRKILIFILIMIQLLVYHYLDMLPILLLKDIFWFSLVLNISFIWHVLLLWWVYKMCIWKKWDYGSYIVTRISLLTSLSILVLLLQFFRLLLNRIDSYFRIPWCCKETRYHLSKCEISYNVKLWESWTHPYGNVKFMNNIFLSIILYFMKGFNNYSLLILGEFEISSSSILKNYKYYLFIILTFILSYIILVPRLYIMWVCILIWNWVRLSKDDIDSDFWEKKLSVEEYYYEYLKRICKRMRYGYFRYQISKETKESLKDITSIYWPKVYGKDYICDYIFFLDEDIWNVAEFDNTTYFDIIDLFVYQKNWRAKYIATIHWTATFSEVEDVESYLDYIEISSERYSVEKEKICEAIRLLSKNQNKLGLALLPIDNTKISLFEYVWCYKITFEWSCVVFL
jgi:hypothetical protein